MKFVSQGFWLILFATIVLAVLTAWDGLVRMAHQWSRDEYSYGYLIPFLVAYFVWQKKNQLARVGIERSWPGVLLVFAGLTLVLFGELAALFAAMQYGFVLALHGIALAALGWKAYRVIAVPLALFFLAVPLPGFLYNNLSQSLQLISSEIGVWVIRLFGVSVFLEGNVIHLATMKLQVAEACNGLRYLFPFLAVGFIVAYVYRAAMWKRLLLFVSTVPIAVLMNSLRIGLIGVSVEYWGPGMTDGIVHGFEGWVVFMGCVGVLLLEMWALNMLGRSRFTLAKTFALDRPEPSSDRAAFSADHIPSSLFATLLVVMLSAIVVALVPARSELIPARSEFVDFPALLDDWQLQRERLGPIYVDTLNVDDYLLGRLSNGAYEQVNLYVAYYGSQRKGSSVHSPRSCIPGDGWEIVDLEQRSIPGIRMNDKTLRVNRVLIRKGDAAQLVYYWFQQRGRVLTNEYLVKWYIFQDALEMRRTDGALIRLTTPVDGSGRLAYADQKLSDAAAAVTGVLEEFVPN